VGNPKGNKALERHRCRWDVNIKINLREMTFGGCGLGSPGLG
jgi:hypothetical protein